LTLFPQTSGIVKIKHIRVKGKVSGAPDDYMLSNDFKRNNKDQL